MENTEPTTLHAVHAQLYTAPLLADASAVICKLAKDPAHPTTRLIGAPLWEVLDKEIRAAARDNAHYYALAIQVASHYQSHLAFVPPDWLRDLRSEVYSCNAATEEERELLGQILWNEAHGNREPIGDPIPLLDFTGRGPDPKTLGALVRKGFVGLAGQSEDATCWLTPACADVIAVDLTAYRNSPRMP